MKKFYIPKWHVE